MNVALDYFNAHVYQFAYVRTVHTLNAIYIVIYEWKVFMKSAVRDFEIFILKTKQGKASYDCYSVIS